MSDKFPQATELKELWSGEEALEYINKLYDRSRQQVLEFINCLDDDTLDASNCCLDVANYPFVGFEVTPENMHVDARLSYGVAIDPGLYGISVTRPDLFGAYYKEQIDLLIKHHKVPVYVGLSDEPIPIPFVTESVTQPYTMEKLWKVNADSLLPDLKRINDDIANGIFVSDKDTPFPLALFNAERVDFSLSRLKHYTATNPKHFQSFILLTNYQRYIKEFEAFAHNEVIQGNEFTSFVGPGNTEYFKDGTKSGSTPEHLPQMPAYHLKREDGQGITLINIGVGPSNAKTITDHLAVLRPNCWLMVGHCAGLRRSQLLGDYVLAHAYIREDHVLDQDLPASIPVPPLAEIQVALSQAVAKVTGLEGHDMKKRMRTGTVVTSDNRNWEMLTKQFYLTFKQSRAIALDLESATIAANGFRLRVPYGTLLCVSDKPIHGEIKLKSAANAFYQERVQQHLKIGIEAMRLLREQGEEQMHSRKLRGFHEPPFR